jgi:Do/DeqQ family serine protease
MRRHQLKKGLLAAFVALATLSVPAAAQYPSVDPRRGVMTLAPLLDRATPAVVNVSVASRVPGVENPLMRDPFFRRFFDLPDEMPPSEAQAAGSGVIVDAQRGLVVTNNHVAENAERITVTLKDQRELEAQLIGSDPDTDLALLQIDADRLVELPFGDSDRIEVGDLVLAIGNPFGLGQTVTSGIISALGRSGVTKGRYENFIQTDAPINPGNSGGALIDTKGQLIGINTAIIAPGGGNVGIGFAVPANVVRAVMDQILRHGEVRRGRIGIAFQDAAAGAGARVALVERGSPAERAGLRVGDMITAIDGAPVRQALDLRNRLGLVEPGREVEVTYVRDGARRTVKVTVAAVSSELALLAGATLSEIPPNHPGYGVVSGVLITRVDRGSQAARLGLLPGDIILGVNGEAISSRDELEALLATSTGRTTLNLLRDGRQLLAIIRR